MTGGSALLGELAVAHYGKALKEAARSEHGSYVVYGSNGAVGRHTQALVAFPTIIVGRKGSVGAVTYAPNGGWPIDTTYYLEPLNHNRIDLRYLYWALGSAALDRRAITTSIPGLNRDELYRTRILVPQLAEQRRIAAALDKADAVRRKRRESLRLLDEFLRSAFLEIFGDPVRNEKRWDVVRLPEVLQTPLRNGLSPSKGGAFIASVLTLTAVTGDRFDPSVVKEGTFTRRIPDEKLVDARDFLICRGNGNRSLTGRGRFPRDLAPGVVFPDTMIAARIDPSRMDPEFFEAVWATAAIRERLQGKARTTSGIYKINQGMLEATRIPLPPLATQRRFARVVKDVRALRARMTAPDWSRFFDSLSAHSFRGDL